MVKITKTEQVLIADLAESIADVFEGNPDAWTKGTLARNIFGDPVSVSSPAATSFCLMGAIDVAISELNLKRRTYWVKRALNNQLREKITCMYPNDQLGILNLNDRKGRVAVIKVVRAVVEDTRASK